MAATSSPSPLLTTSILSPSPNPTSASSSFTFPPYTSFPPFYTLQPNHQTRARQAELWASLILSYSAYHNLYKISLSTPPTALFTNPTSTRSLKASDIRAVLEHMAKTENGSRIEWTGNKGAQTESCYVWYRSPAEWADAIYGWVEETGQRSGVLTVYEIREGEGRKDWRGMDEGMLRKVLGVLVKRGKAQVFGQPGEGEGVKFF